MLRHLRLIAIFCLLSLFFAACNRVPDHRKYIPKDAALVAGINLKALGKTIAWNMITGSKLFKEMQKKVPQKNGNDLMTNIDKAGIDALNTFYVYLKTDVRFKGGIKMTGLVPLSDAVQWEDFLKKNFPQAEIKTENGIKIACPGDNMCVGWNSNLLIIMNTIAGPAGAAAVATTPEMAAEMAGAFTITDDNSIKSNGNFEKLENVGHDITLWINYEQIMNQYMSDNAAGMGGVTLSPAIWKETALACGFDFRKGKITGDISWYASKDMDSVYKEFGAVSASKDMIERLPANNLAAMVAIHISMKGVKSLLDKTGLLGIANAGLQTQGMDADNVFDAFTGDMAFTANDLKLHNLSDPGNWAQGPNQNTDATMCYVIKINKKDNFQKLMGMALETGELHPYQQGYVVPLNQRDSLFIIVSDQYAVTSNKYNSASAIIDGKKSGVSMPSNLVSQTSSHPFNIFIDIQQAMKNVNISASMSKDEQAIYEESSKLLTNVSINGGEYKDHAMQTHLEINFTNTEESSIFTLLDFGMKVSDAVEKARANEPAQPVLAP